MRQINNHGDIILKPCLRRKPTKEAIKAKIHILQQSTTTGNRHEVVSQKAPIFLWEIGGIKYIDCANDYIIQHVGGDCEHGVQKVSKGTVQILAEVEYDPWKNELRIVKD